MRKDFTTNLKNERNQIRAMKSLTSNLIQYSSGLGRTNVAVFLFELVDLCTVMGPSWAGPNQKSRNGMLVNFMK